MFAILGTWLNLRFVLTERQRDCKIVCIVCLARRAGGEEGEQATYSPTLGALMTLVKSV